MAALSAQKVIRRVRQRLGLSQEGLSRLLNATKGAVQHWERGRNNPDLVRLLALRQICPPGLERKDLDRLIREAQDQVAPFAPGRPGSPAASGMAARFGPAPSASVAEGLAALRRDNHRLGRQVNRLEAILKRREDQLRILEDLVGDLRKQMVSLQAR